MQPTLFEPLPPLAGPPVDPVRMRMTVAYDGGAFSGIAPNPGVRTVGGALVEVLERVLRHRVQLSVAGRTDAGVHARGQVVSFDARADADPAALAKACTALLGPSVVVAEASVAAAGFDARHSARSRRYRYLVLNRVTPDPFLAATTWHVPAPLALSSMRLACDPLLGEHDFASFCRGVKVRGEAPEHPPTTVRRVLDARWTELGPEEGLLAFEISATAFCQQMVRSIVGTLVDVGAGRRRAGDLRTVIAARDRRAAGSVAPAHGLCLEEVAYEAPGGAPPHRGPDGPPHRVSGGARLRP